MKKEIIVWQIIVLVLGFSLIFILNQYFHQKNVTEARAAYANCWIEGQSTALTLSGICDPIRIDY